MLSAVIYARDPTLLASFYAKLIGGEPQASPDGRFVTLSPTTRDYEMHIVAVPPEIRERIEVSVPPTPRTETPIKLVIDVDGVDAARSEVTAAGGSVAAREESWTWRNMVHCDAVDPEGNVFQLRWGA